MSSQFSGFGLGYVPTDLSDQNHPFAKIGAGFAIKARENERYRQNANRAPMTPVPSDVMKLPPQNFPQARLPASGVPSLTPEEQRQLAGAFNQLYKGFFTGDGPSLWERMQGWGPDLGSRMSEGGGAVTPYSLTSLMGGATPKGGLY